MSGTGSKVAPTASPQDEDPAPSYDAEPSSSQPQSEAQPPPVDYSIFPKDIVFYRTEYISLIVGPQYEANKPFPPPLFYVSVHMDNRFTNRSKISQMRLHYGPDDTYPVIGTVRFRITTTSDITIWHNSNLDFISNATDNPLSETKIEITKTGALTSALHIFHHVLPAKNGIQVREKYEWKHSGDEEVYALATENLSGENISQQDRGIKLVRSKDAKMIAAFSGGVHNRLYNPKKVAGKLRFVDGTSNEELRLLAVMSILSIIERGRRNAVYNATASFCVFS